MVRACMVFEGFGLRVEGLRRSLKPVKRQARLHPLPNKLG